jgi:hypothetical protein
MNLIEAMNDDELFGPWFPDKSWDCWRIFQSALFGLPITATDLDTFKKHTGRSIPLKAAAKEGWLVVGRRGGKSLMAALVSVYLACFRDYSKFLAPGEVATVMVIAADKKQARTIIRYIAAFIENIPMLAMMMSNRTQDLIELSNNVVIEVHTCNFRSVRGYTIAAAICDEVAFWRSDESANPDTEVIAALRPALSTIPNSLLLCISSPYARRGALWESYKKHFGKDNDPVLVWQADTRSMNPSVPKDVVDQAYLDDESSAAAEYGAEFRRDIETFVSREAVEACIIPNRIELPPVSSINYRAFTDPSGGSADSFTLAISHLAGDHIVLDCVREIKPPFSPEGVCKEFAGLLKSYRVSRIYGDRYAGEWPREQFRKYDIQYLPAEKSKSEIYVDCLPLFNSARVELLDNPRLISQICNLERRVARSGRDSIDHVPGGHDDLANSVAGALVFANEHKRLVRVLGPPLRSPFQGAMTHCHTHTISGG